MTDEPKHRTPYTDDALRVENGTQPDEVRGFVRRRAMSPIKVKGVTIWNFSNHEVNRDALREQAAEFLQDRYVIPYAASGVWGYMVTMLPPKIKEAEILTYRQHTGEYVPYPNYIWHADNQKDTALRGRLAFLLGDDDGRI